MKILTRPTPNEGAVFSLASDRDGYAVELLQVKDMSNSQPFWARLAISWPKRSDLRRIVPPMPSSMPNLIGAWRGGPSSEALARVDV